MALPPELAARYEALPARPVTPTPAPAEPTWPPAPGTLTRSPLPPSQVLQPDTLRQFYRRDIPQARVLPQAATANPAIGASAASQATNLIDQITTATTTSTGLRWRGTWANFTGYSINDVVLFNNSAYVAIKGNTGQEPDTNLTVWTLLAKNLNFRGKFQGNVVQSMAKLGAPTTGDQLTTHQIFPKTTTKGNSVLVFIYTVNEAVTSYTVSDTQGNQYVPLITVNTVSGSNNGIGQAAFLATNIAGGASLQVTTVVAPGSGPQGGQLVYCVELSNIASSDSAAANTSNNTAPATISLTDNFLQDVNYVMGAAFSGAPATSVIPSSTALTNITLDQNGSGGLQSATPYSALAVGGAPSVGANTLGFNVLPSSPASWGIIGVSLKLGAFAYLPYDVVEFNGSFFVCISSTNSTPMAAPTNWAQIAQGTGGVSQKTGNYTAVDADYGTLLSFNSSSAIALTLPAAPPETTWWIAVENIGAGILTVSPNGLTIDGSSSSITLGQNQGLLIFTNGSNYFTFRGQTLTSLVMPAEFSVSGPTNGVITVTKTAQAANTFAAGPVSGAAAAWIFRAIQDLDIPVGNVLSKTANYSAAAGDTGKLISFSSSTAVTLTLPAPPDNHWFVIVQNVGAGTLTISPGAANLDGVNASITLGQNQGVLVFTDGTNYFTSRGVGIGGVNAQTTNYTAVASDDGKLISFNSASALTLTLPATAPSATWKIFVQCVGSGGLTISRNGKTIDSAAANVSLTQNQGIDIYTDGSNYFTERGMGSGGGSGVGGVNAQTTNYTALATDNGKLVTFTSAIAVTLTLPASPPSSTWAIFVENVGAGNLAISPNGLTLDGSGSSLSVAQNQGVVIFTDGTNYFTERGIGSNTTSSFGGVNAQTTNYTAGAGDAGKLISFNSGSALTLTLPAAPPSGTWAIFVECVGSGGLTISRNGLNIDGAATNVSLTQNQGIYIATDGSNYFTSRGMGSGGGSSVGGVNAQTANYTSLSGDSGKIITFNATTSVTLTLPASPPSSTWFISVQNTGPAPLTVSRNSLNIDGVAANFVLYKNEGCLIYTNGSNYFTDRGITAMRFPNNRRISYWSFDGVTAPGTGNTQFGVQMIATLGSGADNSATLGAAFNTFTTTAAANGFNTTPIYFVGNNCRMQLGGCLSWTNPTNARTVWLGLTDQTLATMVASGNPAGNYAAFRFIQGTDTNWQCITKDGTTQNIVNSGVAPSANFKGNAELGRFEIIMDDVNHAVTFLINNVVVAVSSANYPTAGSAMRMVWGHLGNNGSNNATVISWFFGECDQ